MLRQGPLVVWIVLVWIALWGDLSWANVVGGLLVCALVLAAVRPPAAGENRRVALGPSLRYTAVFARDLCIATAEVARQVFWPVDRLRPAVVAVQLESTDPGLLSLVANTITLTPGTLTLEVDGDRAVLWVHVLHLEEGAENKIIQEARGRERLGARALRMDLGVGRTPGRSAGPAGQGGPR